MSPLYIGLAIVVLVVLYLIKINPYRRGTNLPPIIGANIPFLGCAVDFGKNPVDIVRRAYAKCGDIFTFHIAGQNMTFVVGPDAQAVFFKATDEELSPREAYQMMVPIFGKNVVYDSPIPVMYEQLKFIKSGLLTSQLKKAVPMIVTETENYFGRFPATGEVDLLDTLNQLTTLTASRCLLGPEIRDSPEVHQRFAKLYHDLECGINAISFFFPYAPIPSHINRDKARVEVVALFSKVIKSRRSKTYQSDDDKPQDLLQILMDSVYKNGETLTDDAIAGMLIGVLFAGQHTSGITSTWTGFFLHKNPEYLKEVLAEQEELRKEFGDEITFDYIRKAVKLENAVREALRLFPPLITLMRKVKHPLQYKGYNIPVGDYLCVSPGYGMRVPGVFSNPDSFDPKRFERGEHTAKPYSYLAFGGGRHGCPGENFGIMQIKTVWSLLLRQFEFELTEDVPPADYTNLVVGPKQPCMIRYRRKAATK